MKNGLFFYSENTPLLSGSSAADGIGCFTFWLP